MVGRASLVPMGRRGAPGKQSYFLVDDSELLLKSWGVRGRKRVKK